MTRLLLQRLQQKAWESRQLTLSGAGPPMALVRSDGGELSLATLTDDLCSQGPLVAAVTPRPIGDQTQWFLVRGREDVTLNGAGTLGVKCLEPGMILGIGRELWLVSLLWKPDPSPAPPELAGKNCPVCGGPLDCAPVVRCICGRWTHLENPDVPDDPAFLNCYLVSGKCGGCGRESSLEPMIIPEPSPMLFTADDEFMPIVASGP